MPRECHTFLPMKNPKHEIREDRFKMERVQKRLYSSPLSNVPPSNRLYTPAQPTLHPQPYVYPFFSCDTHFSILPLLFATMGLKIGVGFRQRNAYIYACSLNKYDSEGKWWHTLNIAMGIIEFVWENYSRPTHTLRLSTMHCQTNFRSLLVTINPHYHNQAE